jgi:hypothetical protein
VKRERRAKVSPWGPASRPVLGYTLDPARIPARYPSIAGLVGRASNPQDELGRRPSVGPYPRGKNSQRMAASFCMKCGAQLPGGAQFCRACGTPIAAAPAIANPPAPGGATSPGPAVPAAAPSPAAPAGPPLSVVLGLEGQTKFLLEHELLSGSRVYRVLTHEKRGLFTMREDLQKEMLVSLQNAASAVGLGPLTHVWSIVGPSGSVEGRVALQERGRVADSTVLDSNNAPVAVVNVDRGMAGGLTANAAYPDGRPMLSTKGNTLRHNFSIHGPSGDEVAKIHEAWMSVHDAYGLELVGSADPICVLAFAVLIDREKAEQQQAGGHPAPQPHHPGLGFKI